jgi:hypothetical protein
LTQIQLSALHPGSIVIFTVEGTPATMIDKARFTINTTLSPEVTTKRTGTNEYYYQYTIPVNVYGLSVQAELHHLIYGWL